MPNSIIRQIDNIILQIKAKHAALYQIQMQQTKQRGRFQFPISQDERLQRLKQAEQQFNSTISTEMNRLNTDLETVGKAKIINPYGKEGQNEN